MNKKYIKIAAIGIAIFLLAPGCTSKNENNEANKPAMETAQKPPAELKTMLSDIESLISDIAALIAAEKQSVDQIQFAGTSTQAKNDQQDKEKTKSPTESGQDKQTTAKQPADEQDKPAEQEKKNAASDQTQKKWQSIITKLKDTHKNWNKIESSAIKAGLSVVERNRFEKALDDLTLDISERKKMPALQNAVELYGQYANLAKAFKSEIPAEFYNVKYEIMASAVAAWQGNWDQAAHRLPNLKENWNNFKVKSQLKNEQLSDCCDLSVEDFVTAINSNNIDILIIKTEIVLANLGQIEKQSAKAGKN